MSKPDPDAVPQPIRFDQDVRLTEEEFLRLERRWRWAVKEQGNALRIINPDGSYGGWFGRRPPWWKRAHYRLRMWLA
jgi:hypothetical protein